MNNYPIHINAKINEEELQKRLFIFMFRASRVPPHLGIIVNGKLYDISAVGPNIALPINDVYKTIIKRKTEVIFFSLKKPSFNKEKTEEIISEKVKKYWKVTEQCSCLLPVKEFISEVYKLDVNKTNFIFELLPILYKNNLIKKVAQVNLAQKMITNTFYLKKYTKTDVENCINAIKRKEKTTC